MAQRQVNVEAVRLAVASTTRWLAGDPEGAYPPLIGADDSTPDVSDFALALGAMAGEAMAQAASVPVVTDVHADLAQIINTLGAAVGKAIALAADIRGVDAVTILRDVALAFELDDDA